MKISVIGAGYVGLVTALGLAYKGHEVFCIDKNKNKINNLKNGKSTIYEKGVDNLLKMCLDKDKIKFTTKIEKGVKNSEMVFIAVGTPSMEDGNVDLSQINIVLNQISKYITQYKIIINKSTVPVGTQKEVKSLLLKNGVLKENFDVISNPEFLREGKAIKDFLKPDRIVIGYDSEKARRKMETLYSDFDTEIIYTTPETAELIKYASNAFLATKISFINEIANLCNIIGADVKTISYAMGLDQRISPEFLNAGIGFGGSCFPKDIKGLLKIGEKNGYDFEIVKSVLKVNEKQRIKPVNIILEHFTSIKDRVVSVLGLTFKPDTDDTREAPSLYIMNELLKRGALIKCYDPVMKNINRIIPGIVNCNSLYQALEDSICAIICTEWREFENINLKEVKKRMKKPFIIDGRNVLNLEVVRKSKIHYHSIGRDSYTINDKGC